MVIHLTLRSIMSNCINGHYESASMAADHQIGDCWMETCGRLGVVGGWGWSEWVVKV